MAREEGRLVACYRTFPYPEGGLSSKGDGDGAGAGACRRVEMKPITIHWHIPSWPPFLSLSLSITLSLSLLSLSVELPLCASFPKLDIDNETIARLTVRVC